MEKEFEQFRDIVMECGMRRVGGQRRKGSEWWYEVGGAMAEERRAFVECLQRRDKVTYDKYQH